jgi:putative SOS response-associated peptidase YedK
VVALQGFFEWKEDCDKQKQPFFVHKKDGKPILMAALWDWWRLPISEGMVNVTEEEDEEDDCGRLVFSFTILTCGTHGTALSWLHDRMPLMLPSKDVALSWLEGNVSLSSLPHLDLAELAWHPVTKAMNKVAYDGDDVTWDVSKKIAAAAPRPITNFFSKAEGPLSLKAPRKIVAKNPVAKRPKTIRDHFSPSKQYPGEK